MKKFGKLLALCLALILLIVCLALGGCKKTGTQGSETGGDRATTTAEHNTDTTTTTEHNTGTTTANRVGDEVVLPDDDGDVVIGIEGTTSSSIVGSSHSSGSSSSKSSSSSEGSSSSKSSSSSKTAATKLDRAPGYTPIF